MAPVLADPLLLVVLGPTGSGKTALSLRLAERFGGEIVSCDSVAVYRGFEIGTAKPGAAERARAPHHLLDVADPREHYTAGGYARDARRAIAEISGRGPVPIVVGGTGLYLRALLAGLFVGPERAEGLRERLRASAARRGEGYLPRLLRRLDAVAAAQIHDNDEAKLIRAVEVCLAAGQPMSDMWQQGRDRLMGFRVVKVGLDPERSQLYERINARCEAMFGGGLVEETRALVEKYGDGAWALRSLGYKQAMQHLRGEISATEMIASAQQGHRNYAKRQMTWFRREADVHWLHGFGDDVVIQRSAIAMLGPHAWQG